MTSPTTGLCPDDFAVIHHSTSPPPGTTSLEAQAELATAIQQRNMLLGIIKISQDRLAELEFQIKGLGGAV